MSKTNKYFIAIASLLVLILVGSIFKSNIYKVNISGEINAPVNFVYNAINNLAYQDDWNAKASLDTSYRVFCDDHTRGRGVQCTYHSERFGDGDIRILEVAANDSLLISETTDNHKPKYITYKLKAERDDMTKIQIIGSGESGWITNLWNFIHKWKLKKHLNHQLDNLTVFVQERAQQKTYNGYKVELISLDQKYFLSQKAEVHFDNIDAYYTQNISALYQTAIDNKIAVNGMPCALFHRWDEVLKSTEMAAAIPTLSEMFIAGTQNTSIPPGTALKVAYTGDKKYIRNAHLAIQDYMLDHFLIQKAPVIEEYMTSPVQEPNPTKWVSNIYYYVSEVQH